MKRNGFELISYKIAKKHVLFGTKQVAFLDSETVHVMIYNLVTLKEVRPVR